MERGPADVVRARSVVGNAAVTAALGQLPRGAEPATSGWTGQMLAAGQDLVGNQVVASQAVAGPPVAAPKTPDPAKPTGPKAKAPPAPAPKEQAQNDKSTADRPDKGAPKEAAGPRSPGTDPKFQAVKKDVHGKKKRIGSSHPPATEEAGAAQAASVPPADDQEARGKAAHAEDMDAAQPKEFDKTAFVKAVQDAIAKRAPKNLDEADNFGDSGKAEEVKAEVQGQVGDGKEASAREIADTTAEPPEPAADAKAVTPLAADKVPGTPGTPDPGKATPDPLPASATDLSAGPAQVEDQMASAQVTEQQLSFKNSREPSFDRAVKDKKVLDAHSAAAPKKLRAGEARELKQTRAAAGAKGTAAMTAMRATRVATGRQVGAGKTGAKSRDEEKRTTVTTLLQKVFDQTKCDVEKILSDLDKKVDDQFTREEKSARDRFTREHTEGMDRYKDERYSGLTGKARWVKDLFADLPEEANRIYERAKDHYLTAMTQVITNIADTIERELKRAKDRIATGRKELKAAVDALPQDLKAIGREAATEFAGRFDELKGTVDDKGTELIDTLASRYTDAVKAVDEEIAAEKEKNKGLVSKAAEAVAGAIRAIKELASLLMGVLRKAVTAIGLILRDPIGFLGNLVTGVGAGLKLFAKNARRHLEQGVLAWLLGTGATAGLQLPTTFDILGILVMIAALLGISWANLRKRLTRRVPERAVAAAEKGVPILVEVRRHGVKGMWAELKSQVGDLKKDLIGKLVSYLLPTIILAGITWIVSLFNPASAFIRACKMIIDILRFIVTQARQIIDFVNAVLDAVIAIARGGSGGVPALVERALARSIPVLIGALAAILGIGGIAGKVKQIFQQLARPVNRAIDWVIGKIAGLVRKLWAKLKPKKRPTKDRKQSPDRREKKDDRRALDAALRDARALVRARKPVDEIEPRLPAIRRRHKLTKLRLVVERVQGTRNIVHFEAVVNPSKQSPPEGTPLSQKEVQKEYGTLIKNQDMFQQWADQRNIVIDVRPTNKDSVPHLLRGALYKPADVKAKTINNADTYLRIPAEKKGLVGFFVKAPPKPKVRELGRTKYAIAVDRYKMRSAERKTYGRTMQELSRRPKGPGRFVVITYVVHGYNHKHQLKPVAGDHDLYDIRRPDGSRLGEQEYEQLIQDMVNDEFGVMHGAVVYWNPKKSSEKKMKKKLVAQHKRDGSEGLVRFAPRQPAKYVRAETPL